MSSDGDDDSAVLDAIIPATHLESIVYPPKIIAPNGEAVFRWSADGLNIRTVDGANVLMVDQDVDRSVFSAYSTNFVESDFKFGVKCRKLSDLLKSADDNTGVRLRVESLTSKMEITFEDVKYDLASVDLDKIREPDNPELENKNKVRLHSDAIKRAHNIVGMVESAIQFDVGKDSFSILGDGDNDSAVISLETTDSKESQEKTEVFFLQDRGEISAVYGDQYIEKLHRILPEGFIIAEFDDEFPLQIRADRVDSYVSTQITLAPRVGSGS